MRLTALTLQRVWRRRPIGMTLGAGTHDNLRGRRASRDEVAAHGVSRFTEFQPGLAYHASALPAPSKSKVRPGLGYPQSKSTFGKISDVLFPRQAGATEQMSGFSPRHGNEDATKGAEGKNKAKLATTGAARTDHRVRPGRRSGGAAAPGHPLQQERQMV